MKEKYYICESCGELTTETERLSSRNQGSIGLCFCEYIDYEWKEKHKNIDRRFTRYYKDWTVISKDLYELLKNEKNTVLRLRKLNAFPVSPHFYWVNPDKPKG